MHLIRVYKRVRQAPDDAPKRMNHCRLAPVPQHKPVCHQEFAHYRAKVKEEIQMPREIRQIILSKEEFTGAIKSYRRTAQDALPHGDMESYRVTPTGSVQLNMKTYYGGGQQNISIDLSSTHIIDILVRFCIENNIMIPKNSNKSYEVQGSDIFLAIAMDM